MDTQPRLTSVRGRFGTRLRRAYGPVLAIPAVPRLLVSVLLTGAEMGLMPVGVVLMVSGHFDSYARSGLILAAFGVGCATWPFVQARLFHTYGARRCAIPLAVLDAAALTVVLVTCTLDSAVPAIVAAGVAGASRPVLTVALRDAWVGLVGPDERRLRAAIALDASVFEVLYLVGATVGAVVLVLAAPMMTFVVAILSVLIGAVLFVSAGPLPEPVGQEAPDPGVATARPNRVWLVAGWAPLGMVYGTFEVVAPAFDEAGRPAMAGVLLALTAVGSTFGALGYGIRRGTARVERVAPAMVASAAVLLALTAVQGGLLGAAVVAIPLGVVCAPFVIETTRALLASGAASAATPLLWTMTLAVLGNAAGNVVAGAVVDRAGWRAAPVTVATVVALYAAVSFLTRPRRLR